ncbi:MAG: right-handed parallel beta-helix repeat-containing protein [Chthoniobacter sp.]|nr:right-handed parallel beta-helix repeat-containing protein [Chthoniobacter sp.]
MKFPASLALAAGLAMITSLASADDTARVAALFAAAAEQGGTVTIPPGDYALDGAQPVRLASHTTVMAYGARFHLPETLGDKARVVLFSGENVSDFRWFGGHFSGHVFDPAQEGNAWEPNVNTRAILITTTPQGVTENLTVRDVTSDGLAGAAISVAGAEKRGSEREIEAYARNVTVENCTLERSGKFMWDYGLLWQITVWPEDYTPREHAMAAKYFRNDLIRGGVSMGDCESRVRFDNHDQPIPVSRTDDPQNALCFFGGTLPRNIVRGRQYFVVDSGSDGVKIAEQPGGAPIQFTGASGDGVKLIRNLSAAFGGLYAPTGAGPGKGAMDLVGCEKVIVRGCRLSALGDTMHIQKSRGVVFANNHITGSRMGAFFLAEFCQNATITGNTIDGTNGSRVMSVEKSCKDVTITGNTFRNGGRGSWINQPRNFVMTGNIFINNTTKNERDPHRGRRSFVTGDYEQKPELYFTLYEKDGTYGPVIVKDNIFTTGPECGSPAVTFAPGGRQLIFKDNVFRPGEATIAVDPACTEVDVRDNPGATLRREPVDFNHGRR